MENSFPSTSVVGIEIAKNILRSVENFGSSSSVKQNFKIERIINDKFTVVDRDIAVEKP